MRAVNIILRTNPSTTSKWHLDIRAGPEEEETDRRRRQRGNSGGRKSAYVTFEIPLIDRRGKNYVRPTDLAEWATSN